MVDAGRAEEPFELLRPGERKRETLRRLFGYAGLELAATDGGGFTSVPHYAVSSTVHPYRFKAGGTPERLPLGVTDPVDYRQSATAAIVTGRDWRTGQGMVAWAVDAAAEALPSSGRFTLRRRVFQEEIPDPTIPGILLSRCQDLAREGFLVKHEPELRALVNLDVLRRDQVQVYGAAEAGIPEGTLHVVLTLNHRYRVDEGSGEFTLETAAGLRRL
jgi:hypothetical protein